jgi:hypothetical protein
MSFASFFDLPDNQACAKTHPAIACCLVTTPESGKTRETGFLPRRMDEF